MAVVGYSTEDMRVRPSPKKLIVCQEAHLGYMSILVSFLARETPTPGQPLPHLTGDPPKKLIVRQDAHAGDTSLLVSLLDSLARGAFPDTYSHYRVSAYPSVCYHRRTEA